MEQQCSVDDHLGGGTRAASTKDLVVRCSVDVCVVKVSEKARVLVADDHPLTLASLQAILAPYYQLVGAVSDGRALVEEALLLKPDLVILDISMPLLNGIEAARQIRESLPQAKLLFVTMHTSPTYVQAALDAGGTGYVVKSLAHEELLAAAEKVLSGEIYMTPGLSLPD